jgi:RHS repeat-associated protein
VTNNGSHVFTYNTANQTTNAGGYSYLYDGNNKRVKQVDGHGTSYSFYSSNGKLMYRKEGVSHVDYYYMGAKLVAKKKASTVTYLHSDYLGSTAAESDISGVVATRIRYQPFGESIGTVKLDDIGYTGHKFDTDLGLSYMEARYYDPVLGRFMANDPVGFSAASPMTFNRYSYANNNPYKFVDPDGRQGEFVALRGFLTFVAADAATPDPSDAAAPGKVAVYGSAITGLAIGGAITWAVNKAQETNSGNSDGAKTSDRPAGPDGKSGSTGGPGEGKRFGQESPDTKADKEGAPCRYCGQPTTNTPGQPNSRERDHIDPKSRGGNNSPENEGDSCRTCNREKGARNPDEWKRE